MWILCEDCASALPNANWEITIANCKLELGNVGEGFRLGDSEMYWGLRLSIAIAESGMPIGESRMHIGILAKLVWIAIV